MRSMESELTCKLALIFVGDLVGGRSEHSASIPVLSMDPNEGKVSWSRRPVPQKTLGSPEAAPQMPAKARKVNASYSSIKPYF